MVANSTNNNLHCFWIVDSIFSRFPSRPLYLRPFLNSTPLLKVFRSIMRLREIVNKYNLTNSLLLGIFITLFVIGGLGVKTLQVQIFGVVVALILLIIIQLRNTKIKLPPFMGIYAIFLLIFLINSFVISLNTNKSLGVLSLFFGGGLFWLVAYNLRNELSPYFDKLIIFIGLIFAGIYLYNIQFGSIETVKPWSLYLQYSGYFNHNNIGDLWAVVLTIIAYYLIKNPKSLLLWLSTVLGVYLLFISQSRSAIVSLIAGVGYLTKDKRFVKNNFNIFFIFAVLAAILFLVLGAQKTTLFTRQYYFQGAIGLIRNPQGVGVGNFEAISGDAANHIFGLSHFSSVAHNLPLEIVSGLGILGAVFVVWLILIFVNLFKVGDKKVQVYIAALIALSVNFFFHASYFVPTMLWMWFVLLGLSGDLQHERKSTSARINYV